MENGMTNLKKFELLGVITLLMPCVGHALPLYSIQDLGVTTGTDSFATGINQSGELIGYSLTKTSEGCSGCYSLTNYQGFVYRQGIASNLPTLGGRESEPYGINAKGEIVGGSYVTGSSDYHAFSLGRDGMQDLGILSSNGSTLSSQAISNAQAINNKGQIVGYSSVNVDNVTPYHAVLFDDGAVHDLGTLGGLRSNALAINSKGEIAGWSTIANGLSHAFIYDDGRMRDIGTLGGAESSAHGINEKGHVVGSAGSLGDIEHAFFYDGVMHDLGTLGGSFSYAYGINSADIIVGQSAGANGNAYAFLYDGFSMLNLNSLLGENLKNITLTNAVAINNHGQIAVDGMDGDGHTHAYILTRASVPEPSAAGLLAAGLLGFFFNRRRNKEVSWLRSGV